MEENQNLSFFAAANGYSGFRSYFDKVFNPKDFTKIYILKGGPGTGKSTLMKSIYYNFKKSAIYAEAICCSSDPKSLDGVILKGKNGSVAIIDGTAPHERDAVFPGVKDEIINLGDGWDKRWLEGKEDYVIPLCEEKRNAYKTAYLYLKAAGNAHSSLGILEGGKLDRENAKTKIKKLAETIALSQNPTESTRLISAFGKSGLVKFDTLKKISETYIGISGTEFAVSYFIDFLWQETKDLRSIVRFPSPLDDGITEAIYYPDAKLTVAIDNAAKNLICADDFYKFENISKERCRVFSETESFYLGEAARWFNIAADLHARLEEIYSQAMNFENNEKLLSTLTEDISEKITS